MIASGRIRNHPIKRRRTTYSNINYLIILLAVWGSASNAFNGKLSVLTFQDSRQSTFWSDDQNILENCKKLEAKWSFALCSTATSQKYDERWDGYQAEKTDDDEFLLRKKKALEQLKQNKFRGALLNIRKMMDGLDHQRGKRQPEEACEEIDQVFQFLTSRAFAPPYHGNAARNRIMFGVEALTLQLSSNLVYPYNQVPKRVFLNALRALTALNEVKQPANSRRGTYSAASYQSSSEAFRILQRLVTGVGIRRNKKKASKYSNAGIQEKDFNMVLNSFSNIGRMDMAHRIVALQERTKQAPPLSPVAYSILLKGYGRLEDLRNVDMLVSHARATGIIPDTVMLNSLIDAYINCKATDKAKAVFDYMTLGPNIQESALENGVLEWIGKDANNIPRANRRTYNTMMKGLANERNLDHCLALSEEMERKKLWDDVTTNTLVHAAVRHGQFDMAEACLERYTAADLADRKGSIDTDKWHPNIEAYTELMDGYAKAGEFDNAVRVMQTMKNRGVEPNEVTYTCLIAALASQQKVDQAKKLLKYMSKSAGITPTVVTYNAFISALVSISQQDELSHVDNSSNIHNVIVSDDHVEQALSLFYEMMKAGIRPNDVTISALVLALGRCRPSSRFDEAKELVAKLESNEIVSASKSKKVATALIQACGYGGDLKGAIDVFRNIEKPDLKAVNTFLSTCSRCNNEQIALKVFRQYCVGDKKPASVALEPDVVTYSILFGCLLKKNTSDASREAQKLYTEMKHIRGIFPDKSMVDLVLKTIIRHGKLQKKDLHFVADIVRDAEKLDWRPGQLERRKRAIQKVLSRGTNLLNLWKDEDGDLLSRKIKSEDTLLKRKGWNEVDSGFRLWGGNLDSRDDSVDEFLESKGWNNVDSGFRII